MVPPISLRFEWRSKRIEWCHQSVKRVEWRNQSVHGLNGATSQSKGQGPGVFVNFVENRSTIMFRNRISENNCYLRSFFLYSSIPPSKPPFKTVKCVQIIFELINLSILSILVMFSTRPDTLVCNYVQTDVLRLIISK